MREHLNINKLLSGAAVFAALFCFSGDVLAQSNRDINNRMSRLENELETLSRAIYRGERPAVAPGMGGDSRSQANTEVRLQQMEVQIRELTGKLEEQNYEIRQLKDGFERMTTDVEMRLGDLERGGSGGSFGGQSASPSSASAGISPRGTTPTSNAQGGGSPDAVSVTQGGGTLGTISAAGNRSSGRADEATTLYENAFTLLKDGNYAAAEREFDSFLRRYSDHALAANAKYWLGETYYVRGDFERAARIFAEGYQQYPNGSKAADSLLKLGLSLASAGNTKDACVALKQLQKENPDGVGPVGRRADQEVRRLGC